MKTCILGMSDIYGGAAIASYRVHQGLLKAGVDSRMIVGYRGLQDPRIEQAPMPGWLNRKAEVVARNLGVKFTTIQSSKRIASMPAFRDADAVNLHNLHGRWFNYLALPKLLATKPAVFTLHDMWWFTDGEYYDARFEAKPEGYPPGTWEYRLKRSVIAKLDATFACPSRWLTEIARKSFLGQRAEVHHAPLGLDLSLFKPMDREQCRRELKVPEGKTVLMTMAETLSDPRKGIDLLVAALKELPADVRSRCVLMLAGHNATVATKDTDIEKIDLGYLKEEHDKCRAFSAADVVIFPTRMDNLPLVVLEGMACGTPAVSFRVGGVPEMVRPGQTGFLAKPEDAKDLCARIVEAVNCPALRTTMRHECRRVCEAEFSSERESRQYRDLFETGIERKKRGSQTT